MTISRFFSRPCEPRTNFLSLFVIIAAAGSFAWGQPPSGPSEPSSSLSAKPTNQSVDPVVIPRQAVVRQLSAADRDDLEALFDGAVRAYLEEKHIAGATVAVVSGQELIFAKGYGWMDVEKRRPVDPMTTMFRIGSVSKLLTWTAVMQLVEQGRLDLNADINTYLRGSEVTIPETFSTPITLKHLLTHTPGFEDYVIGLFAHDASALKPLGEVLRKQLPARVRPPGEFASYSNHGTALAGYIVERVSGMPWADYIEQKILQPLAMRHTTVRQPDKDQLPADLSRGYKYEQGRFQAAGFEYVPTPPAGSTSSSAGDMARFLLAHLNDGQLGEARILKPETARRMREPLFQHDPKLDAMCYGFWEAHRNGQRLLHHGGATLLFFSHWVMLPERGTGLFVSFNTNTAAGVPDKLVNVFLDRYYPREDAPLAAPPADFHERAGRFIGAYKLLRHDYTHAAKLGQLLSVVNVSLEDDGALLVDGPITLRLAEIGPLEFAEIGGQNHVTFREDPDGNITHMFLGSIPAVALEKLDRHETTVFQLAVLAISLLLFVSAVIGWPLAYLATRGRLIAGRPATIASRAASGVGWLGSAVLLASFAATSYAYLVQNREIVFGLTPLMTNLLRFAPVCLGLAAAMLVLSVLAWAKSYWRLSGRIHFSLVALAAVAFAWQLHYWNLLPLWPGAAG